MKPAFLFLLFAALTTLINVTSGSVEAQAPPAPSGSSSPVSTLPDLVVMSIGSDNLDSGEVKVKIKNQGMRRSARSDVALAITWGSKTANFVHASIPLNPGQVETVIIDVKASLVQASFCATADGLNKVTESNENNNRRCGQFGGKL